MRRHGQFGVEVVAGNKLDLIDLRYFMMVADAGSLAKVVAQSSVTKATLNKSLRDIETRLGTTLFEKSSRGFSLNDAGRRFYDHAAGILKQVDNAKTEITQSNTIVRGAVSIGLPPIAAKLFAVPLVERVAAQYPDIRLHLLDGYSWDVKEWLEGGRINLGLYYDGPRTDRTFASPLLVEELHLIGRPHDDALARSECTLADIFQLPIIVPTRPHGNRLEIERIAAEQHLTLNIAMEVDSLNSLIRLLVAGFGYGLLPLFAVSEQLMAYDLKAVRIVNPPMRRTLLIGTSARRKVSRNVSLLMPIFQDLAEIYQPTEPDLESEGE